MTTPKAILIGLTFIAVAIALPTTSFAEVYGFPDRYPRWACKEMYESIGVLLDVADKAWKSQDEEKALLYSTAAANYSTVYEVFCKR